jgi:hypothetical protein
MRANGECGRTVNAGKKVILSHTSWNGSNSYHSAGFLRARAVAAVQLSRYS